VDDGIGQPNKFFVRVRRLILGAGRTDGSNSSPAGAGVGLVCACHIRSSRITLEGRGWLLNRSSASYRIADSAGQSVLGAVRPSAALRVRNQLVGHQSQLAILVLRPLHEDLERLVGRTTVPGHEYPFGLFDHGARREGLLQLAGQRHRFGVSAGVGQRDSGLLRKKPADLIIVLRERLLTPRVEVECADGGALDTERDGERAQDAKFDGLPGTSGQRRSVRVEATWVTCPCSQASMHGPSPVAY
jgi:hypothetical protein